MAEPTTVAAMALPSDDDIARAEAFTREPFVHPGEEPAVALAPGTPRRRALDQALAELDAGSKIPSTAWRREYSLLLGLERVLSEEEPKLADGTVLSAHQVDALSGTLTALLAEAHERIQRQRQRSTCSPAPRILGVDGRRSLPMTPASRAERAATSRRRTVDEDEPRTTRTRTTRTSTAPRAGRGRRRRRRGRGRGRRARGRGSTAPRPRRRWQEPQD